MKTIQVAKEYFNSLETANFEKLGSLLADDIVWHQPGKGALSKTYKGKAEVFGLFGKFMEISGGSFKIDHVSDIMENGNLVSATLHFTAKKPTGEIAMNGVDLMRIENGQIQEVHLFSADQDAEDKFWD